VSSLRALLLRRAALTDLADYNVVPQVRSMRYVGVPRLFKRVLALFNPLSFTVEQVVELAGRFDQEGGCRRTTLTVFRPSSTDQGEHLR
jgi:hypothetical protein